MESILFVHGYSAESKKTDFDSVKRIYGDQSAQPNLNLPDALRAALGGQNATVLEMDLSRYVSLDDGINLDDISRAFDRALRKDFAKLLDDGCNVIVHSTGALVIRNWLRLFSPKPSPIRRLIYLAGANFGSGWAHIGKGQLAQWARYVFEGGAEAGVRVLEALELGSNETIDLHLSFLKEGCTFSEGFQVREAVIIGSQAEVHWFEVPVRYAKEDGSDGVVRVSACNVNFNYLRLAPNAQAQKLSPITAKNYLADFRERREDLTGYYEVAEASRPGDTNRPEVPFAIPYQASHSGARQGVVSGAAPRVQVLRLLKAALTTAPTDWPSLVPAFQEETKGTLERVLKFEAPQWWNQWIHDTRKQYDAHALVIFRLRDQDDRPIDHYDIFFNSIASKRDQSLPFNALIEDKHVNSNHGNIFTLYLRTSQFKQKPDANDTTDPLNKQWVLAVPKVNGCTLEVSAVEPETGLINYLPMRFEFSAEDLNGWLVGHQTTVIDIQLLRLPQPGVFMILRDK